MTFTQMHDLFDQLIDKVDAPYFDDGEKDRFLNLAQMEFIKQRYSEFEFDEKRREDLVSLVTEFVVTGTSILTTWVQGVIDENATAGITMNSIDKDYLFIVDLSGDFNVACGSTTTSKRCFMKPLQRDDLNKALKDPFNKPTNESPAYVQIGYTVTTVPFGGGTATITRNRNISIYADSAPTKVVGHYIKKPVDIDGENNGSGIPELPEHTHEEIVNLAVRKAFSNIEDYNKYRAQVAEINEME